MSEDRQLEREEELQASLVQNNVASIRAQVPKEKMGPEFCTECDEPIHIDRRMMGYSRCVMCVEIEEKRAKQYGKSL